MSWSKWGEVAWSRIVRVGCGLFNIAVGVLWVDTSRVYGLCVV